MAKDLIEQQREAAKLWAKWYPEQFRSGNLAPLEHPAAFSKYLWFMYFGRSQESANSINRMQIDAQYGAMYSYPGVSEAKALEKAKCKGSYSHSREYRSKHPECAKAYEAYEALFKRAYHEFFQWEMSLLAPNGWLIAGRGLSNISTSDIASVCLNPVIVDHEDHLGSSYSLNLAVSANQFTLPLKSGKCSLFVVSKLPVSSISSFGGDSESGMSSEAEIHARPGEWMKGSICFALCQSKPTGARVASAKERLDFCLSEYKVIEKHDAHSLLHPSFQAPGLKTVSGLQDTVKEWRKANGRRSNAEEQRLAGEFRWYRLI